MTSFRQALNFILAQQRGRTSASIAVESIEIAAGKKRHLTDIYTPTRAEQNPIVFLHGMSPQGIRDPRQIIAARALAASGFRVICPELSEIKQLKITAASIDTFGLIVSAILQDVNLSSSGRVALFAPSFSGAICLKAASMPQLRDHIASVCALGSMAQVRGSAARAKQIATSAQTPKFPSTMQYLFLSDTADTYARYIVLSNYLLLVKKYRPLAPVFLAQAHDNWCESASKNPALAAFLNPPKVPAALKKLSPKNRARAIALKNDVAYRAEVFKELTPYMERELEAYDIVAVANRIMAPTLLMHGKSDNVIPPGESIRLAPYLKQHRLVVSPFLGHADTDISLKRIADVWRLVSGFAYFFRHAAI